MPSMDTAKVSHESAKQDLAAVSDFLERTSGYQLSGSRPAESAPPGTVPAATAPSAKHPIDKAVFQRVATPNEPAGGADLAVANAQVVLEDDEPPHSQLALPVLTSLSIRPPRPVDVVAAEPVKHNTTNEPLKMSGNEAVGLVDRLVARLKKTLADAKDFDTEWQLRLTQLAFHRDSEATQVSSFLSADAQKLLRALMGTAVAIRRVARHPLEQDQDVLARVDELRDLVSQRADPVISDIALCRKVDTFGVYDEMTSADFVAGRSIQTIVYTEIRRFRSDKTDDGQYRTRLATRLAVLTADGKEVWQHGEPEIEDRCRRRRTDFFIAQRITLPPTLPAGDYILKVLVEDQLSGRADETTHPFTVNSITSLAKTP